MFIAPFLGVLRGYHPDLKHNSQLGKAVEACKNGVGCSKHGFDTALDTVESELGKLSGSLGGRGIQQVVNAVKNVSAMRGNQNTVSTLAGHVKRYFDNVLERVADDNEVKRASNVNTHIGTLNTQLGTLVDNVGSQNGDHPINVGMQALGKQTSGLKEHIDKIYAGGSGTLTELRKAFPDFSKKPVAFALSAATHTATTAFVTVLQTDYTSYYKDATWDQVSGKEAKCAKIFIACLPLMFNGLSYFYWKCSGQGGWKDMTLGSPEPKAFIGLTSIGPNRVKSGRKGADILSQAFKNFNEFKTASTSNTTSYGEFLTKFRGNCFSTWQSSQSSTATDSNFLSGLYLCSTSYFRHQHHKKAAQARPPSSIREMLYWLMGLTATPQFGDLLRHIHNVVGNNFKVAVSGSSRNDDTLTADKVTSYILSTCYTAPSVLDIIQGRVAPEASPNDPWLHDLYSNTEFNLKYPSSGAALFYALADYTYALQFQLTFLYNQSQDMFINTCGWQFCTFGKTVNQNTTSQIVESHICLVGCTTSGHKSGNDHASGYCEHNGCGSGSKASPSKLSSPTD